MQTLIIILQAGGGAGGGFDIMNMVLIFGIFIAFMYFFSIRPQQKRDKEQREFIDQLGKGDKVITSSGIHGKILRVDDTTMLIEIDNNVKIRIEKAFISGELTKHQSEKDGGSTKKQEVESK